MTRPSAVALPIDSTLPAIRRALASSASLIIEAPPGAGKTTRVPLALLEERWLGGQRIVVLEPRRLAARAAAGYMASLLGEQPGETVGYRMRSDTRIGTRTRIEVVTEGVLTRMLQHDPAVDGIGCIIFDEFHERSLHADTGLAFALQSRSLLRPELRIIIMSATLDGQAAAELLDGAPVVRTQGRVFPVATHYAEHPVETRIEDAMASAIRGAIANADGDVLAFLPGAAEIHRTAERLREPPLDRADVIPLFGDLPREQQQRAIEASPRGRRKIVLATSIAETSLTIDGVRIVVDSGLMRIPRFSARTGMTRLDTVRVTRDAADQRRGRAGRTAPGECHRLWTMAEETGLIPRRTPEILEADLAPLALELAAWGIRDPAALRWLDPPPAGAFAQARELLAELEALGPDGSPTAHGRRIIELPAHPRIAHMLVEATDLGLVHLACDIAALIDERDVVRRDEGPADADIRIRLDALRTLRSGGRTGSSIDRSGLRRVRERADEWRRRVRADGHDRIRGDRQQGENAYDSENAGRLLAFAWPDRIGRARGERGRFVLRNGSGVAVPSAHALAGSEYIVAAVVGGRGGDAAVHLGAPLDGATLETDFGTQFDVTSVVEWDRAFRAVRTEHRTTLGAIVIRRSSPAYADPERVRETLLEAVRSEGIGALPWSDAALALRNRLAFLRTTDDAWPDVSDDALLAALDTWLGPWLGGVSSFAQLREADLHSILLASIDPARRARLDSLAPTHVEVPSGSRIAIDYSDPDAPALAVRLQELFGLLESPRLADGRVTLTIRLLSPAMRPVQVTRDLASFWKSGYFDVKKDLKGRYPKHYWPEDPLTATATRRTRPRG